MLAKDIMTRDIVTVNEGDSVLDVMELFEKRHISGAPIVNDAGEYVGIFSKSDFSSETVLATLKSRKSMKKLTVKAVKGESDIISVDEDDTAAKIAEVMATHKVHRVLVKNRIGKYVGILTSMDISKAHSLEGWKLKFEDTFITEREKQLIRLFIQEHSVSDMANIFYVSEEKIVFQINELLKKLSAADMKHAATKALEQGLV